MALIIYPTTDWDSFISVADCETMSDNYIANNQFGQLADEAAKEVILRQTTLQIKQCPNIELPATAELDLQMAQVYLVEQALTVDMVAYDPTDESIISETVDTISVTRDPNRYDGAETFPPMVTSLLTQYGCSSTSGGFMQVPLGRA